jgi:hypothetical protein
LKSFLFAFLYGILFYLLQFTFLKIGLFTSTPNSQTLLALDAGFYESIAREGYKTDSNSSGFFILFPFIWRLLQQNLFAIILSNILFYSVGFSLITNLQDEKDETNWLLWLSLPSLFFVFVPYSDALFFMLSAIVLYTSKHKHYKTMFVSLILLSMTRATCILLIPAFFIMELMGDTNSMWLKSTRRFLTHYALPQLIGLFIFIFWQYKETGIWFIYFIKQSTVWDHHFSWTAIPLVNFEDSQAKHVWLNALAMFIDLFAISTLVKYGIQWLKKNKTFDKTLLVSLTYLSMVLLCILFMNPRYGRNVTIIVGLHRYTFVTPFVLIVLHHLTQLKITLKHIGYTFLITNLLFILFHAYLSLEQYTVITILANISILTFLFSINFKQATWLKMLLFAINLFIQLFYFQRFLISSYMD